jgi:hypothetical protein
LREAVDWCTDRHVCIIDWLSFVTSGWSSSRIRCTTHETETYEFWSTIARNFAGIIQWLLRVFNEPTIYRGELGSLSCFGVEKDH